MPDTSAFVLVNYDGPIIGKTIAKAYSDCDRDFCRLRWAGYLYVKKGHTITMVTDGRPIFYDDRKFIEFCRITNQSEMEAFFTAVICKGSVIVSRSPVGGMRMRKLIRLTDQALDCNEPDEVISTLRSFKPAVYPEGSDLASSIIEVLNK